MKTIILKHGSTSRPFRVHSIKGLKTPESVILVKSQQHQHLDGFLVDENLGYRRRITIDFGFVDSEEDRLFLLDFFLDPVRSITEDDLEVAVSLEDVNGYEFDWFAEVEFAKMLTATFLESNTNLTSYGFPPQPGGGQTGATVFLKNNVRIDGTPDSPEQFETGTGKLLEMETGQPYPEFSSTHSFSVILSQCQEAVVARVKGSESIVNGKIRFQAFASKAGRRASDGFCYADIAIMLQAKP